MISEENLKNKTKILLAGNNSENCTKLILDCIHFFGQKIGYVSEKETSLNSHDDFVLITGNESEEFKTGQIDTSIANLILQKHN